MLLVALGAAVPARAQARLVLPTSIAASAAAADWVSTYCALTRARVRESNPVLRPFEQRPLRMVLLGGAIDVASVWAWNRGVGTRPVAAASGLWAMAAFRAYLAVHNFNIAHRFARSRASDDSETRAATVPRGPSPALTIPPLGDQ